MRVPIAVSPHEGWLLGDKPQWRERITHPFITCQGAKGMRVRSTKQLAVDEVHLYDFFFSLVALLRVLK